MIRFIAIIFYLIIGVGIYLGLAELARAEAAPPRGGILWVNEERLIRIHGPIRNGILNQADRLVQMSKESRRPVYIELNSPGGSVLGLLYFISAMERVKGNGVRIQCYVTGLAMSAAFSILAECDGRYAFSSSMLMFHPVSIGIMRRLGQEELRRLHDSLKATENYLVLRLRRRMLISDEDFQRHYEGETVHSAESLNVLSPGFTTIIRGLRTR